LGTVVGAAAGAALGGRSGAAAGAGGGLLIGSAAGAGAGETSAYGLQRRYDYAYIQCMYAKGHKVPCRVALPLPRPVPATRLRRLLHLRLRLRLRVEWGHERKTSDGRSRRRGCVRGDLRAGADRVAVEADPLDRAVSAGGPADVVTRLLSAKLAERVGHAGIVENRGGAGGNVGHEAAAKAPPDGTTVVFVVPRSSPIRFF